MNNRYSFFFQIIHLKPINSSFYSSPPAHVYFDYYSFWAKSDWSLNPHSLSNVPDRKPVDSNGNTSLPILCLHTPWFIPPIVFNLNPHKAATRTLLCEFKKKKKKSTLWVAKLGREKLEEWPHFQVYLSWQAERGQYFLSTCLLALWAVLTLQRPQFKFILMTFVHNFLFI